MDGYSPERKTKYQSGHSAPAARAGDTQIYARPRVISHGRVGKRFAKGSCERVLRKSSLVVTSGLRHGESGAQWRFSCKSELAWPDRASSRQASSTPV